MQVVCGEFANGREGCLALDEVETNINPATIKIAPARRRMTCVSFHSEKTQRASTAVISPAAFVSVMSMETGTSYFVNPKATSAIPPAHVAPTRKARDADEIQIDL